ncbi:hypothetical protein MMC19_001402 [Ptychographa xylographoides]|nr:hypothetical protein [Ptychographa xylographoides]
MRIPNSKRLNYLLYSLMALVTFANGAAVIVFLAQCRPLEALWDPAVNGNCWNEEIYIGFGEFQGAVSAFTDLICSALPVLVLWKVRISLNVKVAVCTLMGLGLVASACSLVRNILLHTIENPVDITWNVIPIQIWALCEMNLSILAASMPTFLPLYRFLREKVPQTLSHLQTYFVKSSSSSSSSYTATETYPPSRPNTFNANDHYSRLHPTHIRKTVDFEVDVDGNSTKHDKTSLQRDSSETELQKVTMWV